MRDVGSLGNAIEPQGLHELRGRVQDPSEEDLAEVAKQFEAVFVEMMLKQMRAATPGEDIFGGNAEETYRGLFDRQMAVQMARGEGMGLAPMIEEQLRVNAGFETDRVKGGPRDLDDYRHSSVPLSPYSDSSAQPGSEGEHVSSGDNKAADKGNPVSFYEGVVDSARASLSQTTPLDEQQPGDKGPAWSTPREFVEDITPLAKDTAERLGVSPVALIAQAALETGWGKHVIQDSDGVSSNNLFNIKAQYSGWNGDSVKVPTLEYRNGVAQREMADFRAYESLEDSFADYADFLERNPRYQEALRVGDDPEGFVRALQDAGYATDPNYARKLQQIMDIDPERGVGVRAGTEVLKISDSLPNS
ncbi:flagellar assembly peptidoglycan hydrolase FlgJ [Halorhodospira halochloris]|uniref:flagellar assembly peptidoglycan hydrolase FlgJ n=1 Tax=Halorhodospira halochloris TaxID=1052 RepID=UPI001EE9057A|nr:flagellar assembly peptidoglycan hydrolase FlgJ [Halorhodospira halochloris]MCG5530010.1 flagellar assembly peptidoglycan hydrolase FlgJ [Halorhodospira halochloris]